MLRLHRRPFAIGALAALLTAFFPAVLMVLPAASASAATESNARPVVRDVAYGETLFAFYQKQYFSAISRLLVARERGEFRQQANDGDLLLGGLYVQYGLPDAAAGVFERLAPGDEAQATRVWLALAELNYRRARFPEALAIVEQRYSRDSAPEEAVVIAVKSLMRLGRYREAISWLGSRVAQRPEARYLRFNLAVAQVADGDADVGAVALESLLEMPADDDEMRALRDRVALALAATRLQQQRPAQAVKAISGARLNGPYSGEALLVYGIASQRNAELSRATTVLATLTKQSPHTQAVQEGLISLAQVYEARNDQRRALGAYRNALKLLQGELNYLQEQSASIDSGAWFSALERRASDISLRDDRIGLSDADVLGMPLHYRQFAGNRFVLTFTQYVEVSVLARLAADWQNRVPVLAYLVDSREQRHIRLVDEAETLLTAIPEAPLQDRQRALAQRLDVVVAANEPQQLASAPRQKLLAMIAQMEERMARWPDRDWTKQRERLALLKGVLQWEIAREQPAQAWGLRRAVRDNGRLVDEAIGRRAAVARAMARQQTSVDGWLPSLAADEAELKRLATRSVALRQGLRQQMEDDARKTIQENRERIVQLAADAYYGIAQIEHGRWRESREARREREAAAAREGNAVQGVAEAGAGAGAAASGVAEPDAAASGADSGSPAVKSSE